MATSMSLSGATADGQEKISWDAWTADPTLENQRGALVKGDNAHHKCQVSKVTVSWKSLSLYSLQRYAKTKTGNGVFVKKENIGGDN